ncbi:MAG: DUF305 domain-containing protein [Gammaproteobacteria bacterium]
MTRTLYHCVLIAVLAVTAGSVAAQAPIVQPGKPGEASRRITTEEAIQLASVRYSLADVRFMQDMISHHQQALDMAALLPDRTARNEMMELAQRIESSQKDEIEFMTAWLGENGEAVSAVQHAHDTMKGMAMAEQMEALAAASGETFDAMFLDLMITHHEGALTMVEELLDTAGAAQTPVMFEFTRDVRDDQEAEIERMVVMLANYSPDPRVGLAAGLRDAGEAIHNVVLVASLPKADGFFDPENPSALPASRLRELRGEAPGDDAEADDDEEEDRASLMSFSITDMAFAGDLLVVGSYHGFKVYNIAGAVPELVSAVVCPGGQGDVSIVGDLLIMSVEQLSGRVDCGLMGVAGEVSEERFRGLRIFDLADPTLPRQVGQVQTCRGSHTHTVVTSDEERIIVYNSGTAPVRDEEELAGCSDKDPYRDEGTALFRIDVIEIPVDRPQDARIVDSPAVFADPESGVLAGLWERGDHGPDTQTTAETNHCHDITVFPGKQLAAGACSGNGILFDISDPLAPRRIDAVIDPAFAYWHSATFNNDGTKVLFTDEWGGGTRARCQASDPLNWGANALYDIVDGKLEFRAYYKMPAPQTAQENCVAHNGSLIPVPGRDIMVQAWYQGGISVFDFTATANPIEIAWFDRGPIDEKALLTGGFWSAYWHDGRIYGTEIVRGLDVLALLPSDHISEHELAAALLAKTSHAYNPQQQSEVRWPADPVVARAYIDQLQRADRLLGDRAVALERLLGRAERALADGKGDAELAGEMASLAADLGEHARDQEGSTRRRLVSLADTLERIAARVNDSLAVP